MPNRPLNIPELLFPARLPIRATLALIRYIQRGLAEPASIVSEDGDTFLRILDMGVVVSTDMFSEAVNENEQRLGLISFVGPGVEIGSSGTSNPALFERSGGHARAGKGRVLGMGAPLSLIFKPPEVVPFPVVGVTRTV